MDIRNIILYVTSLLMVLNQTEPVKFNDHYTLNFTEYVLKNDELSKIAKYDENELKAEYFHEFSSFMNNYRPWYHNDKLSIDSLLEKNDKEYTEKFNNYVSNIFDKIRNEDNYYYDLNNLIQSNYLSYNIGIYTLTDDVKRFIKHKEYKEYYELVYGNEMENLKIDLVVIISNYNIVKSILIIPLRFDVLHEKYNYSFNYKNDTINIYRILEEKIDFENEFIISNNPDSNRYKLEMVYKITSEGFLVNEYYRTTDDDWEEGDAYH